MELSTQVEYQQLLGQIAQDYQQGPVRGVQAVTIQFIEAYWQVAHRIVEFDRHGE